MTQLKNKTILITGGASGIGKIMSRLSLERDANVIIWDINTQNIENTCAQDLYQIQGRFSAEITKIHSFVDLEILEPLSRL